MGNCKLDENFYSKIKDAMDMSEPKHSYANDTVYKSFYGPGTLINDWIQKRTEAQSPIKSNEPLLSENMDQFRPLCTNFFPDKRNYFIHLCDSYGLGQELLMDHLGFTYYNNYTTSYDLSYNHLKKNICGPFPRHYFKGQYVPETDLTKVYGNLTQWGLKEKVYESMKHADCEESSFISETYASFVPHDKCIVKKLNDFKNFKRVEAVFN